MGLIIAEFALLTFTNKVALSFTNTQSPTVCLQRVGKEAKKMKQTVFLQLQGLFADIDQDVVAMLEDSHKPYHSYIKDPLALDDTNNTNTLLGTKNKCLSPELTSAIIIIIRASLLDYPTILIISGNMQAANELPNDRDQDNVDWHKNASTQ